MNAQNITPKLADYPGLEAIWLEKYWPQARGGIECICSPTLEMPDMTALHLQEHPQLTGTLQDIARQFLPLIAAKLGAFVTRSRLEFAANLPVHSLPSLNTPPNASMVKNETILQGLQEVYENMGSVDAQLQELYKNSLEQLKISPGFQQAVSQSAIDEYKFPLVSENSNERFIANIIKFCAGAAREYSQQQNQDAYSADRRLAEAIKKMGMIVPNGKTKSI